MRTHAIAIPALVAVAMLLPSMGGAVEIGRVTLSGNVSPILAQSVILGPAPVDTPIEIVMALKLHDAAGLDQFLADVQDPASPVFHQFLTQEQFNQRFAPTATEEAAVEAFLVANGFTLTQTFSNHLLVGAKAPIGVVEQAFNVHIASVSYDGQVGYATIEEPSVPATLAPSLTGVLGLDNLGHAQPRDNLGTNCCYWSPRDTNNFYNEDHNGAHTGAGQTIVIVGAYDFLTADFTGFNAQMGLSNPSVTRVCAGSGAGCAFSSSQSTEISLDIEYAHGTAPSAALVSVMSQSTLLTDFTTAYNTVVTRNDGHSVSTSWGLCEKQMAAATRASDDSIFANGNAIGQSWFAASGDSGSNDCPAQVGRKGVDYPASSPYVMGVGGTHGTCPAGSFVAANPVCSGYGSETGWSGSGGGDSAYYAKPSWQTGCTVPTGNRHVPDVSLIADSTPGYLVAFNGAWYAIGGTSAAAPQVAAMFAGLDQAKATGGVGNPGTRLYQLCAGNSFHDVTSGSNGGYSAVAGYDRVTGIGTINEGNLITNW